MRALVLSLILSFLAACGGESGGDTIISSSGPDRNASELSVFIAEAEQPVRLQISRIATSESSVVDVPPNTLVSLGEFERGEEVEVLAVNADLPTPCPGLHARLYLLEAEHALYLDCSRDGLEQRPKILNAQWGATPLLYNPNSLFLAVDTEGRPVTGVDVLLSSGPEGAALTIDDSFPTGPRITFPTPGDYEIAVYIHTATQVSQAKLLEVSLADRPPEIIHSIEPAQAFTDTPLSANADIWDERPDSLVVSYAWSVNGALLPLETAETLTADQFAKGDSVELAISADDGINPVVRETTSVVIQDSPATVAFTGLPAEIPYGQPFTFDLDWQDVDGDPLNVELVYGPPGMALVDGQLQWSATPLMARGIEYYRVGVQPSGDASRRVGASLGVRRGDSPMFTRTLKATLPLQDRDTRRWVDTNGNGLPEFPGASGSSVFMTEVDVSKDYLDQIWAAPLFDNRFPPTAITAFQVDGDWYVASVVSGGKTHVYNMETGLVVSTIDDTATEMYAVTRADGSQRLLLRATGINRVYDGLSGELLFSLNVFSNTRIGVIGNVDNDPQDEIITAGGDIYDGESGESQWSNANLYDLQLMYDESRGYNLLVRRQTDSVVVTDVVTRTSETVAMPGFVNALIAGNFDADASDEIWIRVSSGDFTLWEIDGGGLAETATSTSEFLSGEALDVDDDGVDEIVLPGTGAIAFRDITDLATTTSISRLYCDGNVDLLQSELVTGAPQLYVGANCFDDVSVFRLNPDEGIERTIIGYPLSNFQGRLAGVFALGDVFAEGERSAALVTDGSDLNFSLVEYPSGVERWKIPGGAPKDGAMFDTDGAGTGFVVAENNAGVAVFDPVAQVAVGNFVYDTVGSGAGDWDLYQLDGPQTYITLGRGQRLRRYGFNGGVFSGETGYFVPGIKSFAQYQADADALLEYLVYRQDMSDRELILLDDDLTRITAMPVTENLMPGMVVWSADGAGTYMLSMSLSDPIDERHLRMYHLESGEVVWEGPSLGYSTTQDMDILALDGEQYLYYQSDGSVFVMR